MTRSVPHMFVFVASLALVACGGSDGSSSGESSNSDSESSAEAEDSGSSGGRSLEGAREVPCQVIPLEVIDEVLGGTHTATRKPGGEAVCEYSGDNTFGIAWGPGFAASVERNFDRADGAATKIDGLGDFAYQYEDLELAVALGGDSFSIQGELDMATQGRALAEAILEVAQG